MMITEPTSIDAKIEYECNIVEYMLKPTKTKTNNKIRFLFHPNLYSTYNYRSSHGLILGMSIKTRLRNLGDATLNHLNYLGLSMSIFPIL
jgi:hypothetical protein